MKALSDCRLLLVDDAPANLDILVEGLKSEYKLSVARDGEAALASATRAIPDLVLLDIVMILKVKGGSSDWPRRW